MLLNYASLACFLFILIAIGIVGLDDDLKLTLYVVVCLFSIGKFILMDVIACGNI